MNLEERNKIVDEYVAEHFAKQTRDAAAWINSHPTVEENPVNEDDVIVLRAWGAKLKSHKDRPVASRLSPEFICYIDRFSLSLSHDLEVGDPLQDHHTVNCVYWRSYRPQFFSKGETRIVRNKATSRRIRNEATYFVGDVFLKSQWQIPYSSSPFVMGEHSEERVRFEKNLGQVAIMYEDEWDISKEET